MRRNKLDQAKQSLLRLRSDSPNKEQEVEATLAYIRHTTELEMADTEGANLIECFKGTNLRRTEIVSLSMNAIRDIWEANHSFEELHDMDVSGPRWQSVNQLCCRLP